MSTQQAPAGITVQEGARRVLAAIAADVAAGVVPWDVPDFSALHDFVDANMYVDDLLPAGHPLPSELDNDAAEAEAAWFNGIADLVNEALTGVRNAPPAGHGEDYAEWVSDRKYALRETRAAAFGYAP